MKPFLPLLACVATAFVLTGCETTGQGIPAPQVQSNLASVKLGMNKEQVFALIGKPGRVNDSTDASGFTEQWIYTESQFWTAGQAFAAGMATGGRSPAPESLMVLTFKNGRLVSRQTQGR